MNEFFYAETAEAQLALQRVKRFPVICLLITMKVCLVITLYFIADIAIMLSELGLAGFRQHFIKLLCSIVLIPLVFSLLEQRILSKGKYIGKEWKDLLINNPSGDVDLTQQDQDEREILKGDEVSFLEDEDEEDDVF